MSEGPSKSSGDSVGATHVAGAGAEGGGETRFPKPFSLEWEAAASRVDEALGSLSRDFTKKMRGPLVDAYLKHTFDDTAGGPITVGGFRIPVEVTSVPHPYA